MDPEIKSIEIANPEIEYLRETVLELAKNAARTVTTMDKVTDYVERLEKRFDEHFAVLELKQLKEKK